MYKMRKSFFMRVLPVLLCLMLIASIFMMYGLSTNAAVSPWTSGISYAKGDLVSYQDKTYECLQPHTSLVGWEPPNVASLWKASIIAPSDPPGGNTPVSTFTPTNTSTSTTGGFKVSGYIKPDVVSSDANINAGFKAEITGTSLSTTSDTNGYFILNVPDSLSTYSIKISKPSYLSRTISNISATGNAVISTSNLPLSMWAGDIRISGTQDDAINMMDVMEVAKSFNSVSGDTIYKIESDLDRDGAINMNDIMIMVRHFNQVSSNYPQPVILIETPSSTPTPTSPPTNLPVPSPAAIIPKPVSYQLGKGYFTLTNSASIYVQGNSAAETDEINQIGLYLAGKLKPSTGYSLNVVKSNTTAEGSIYLTTIGGTSSMGNEGYTLEITLSGVKLTAYKPEGLFRGIQTIRQSLSADIEKSTVVLGKQWLMPCSTITDSPAYPWRGCMLDVARHFFSVNDVKRCIDLMAQYKMNRFHMHLSDDQGWRIEIKSWPDLTRIGGSTQVGGGTGGYYTQEQFIDLVNYAKERYITLVPEIDMPGHSNAALASYGQLNPDGQKKPLYTGMEVGFSTLMCRSEVTYSFADDVIRELSSMTAGEYIHIGGDESNSTSTADYDYFIGRVKTIVNKYGKKMIGWDAVDTSSGVGNESILQNWVKTGGTSAKSKGMKIICSPSEKTYIDMKYNSSNPIGLIWAGYNPTDDAYQWDPTNYVPQDLALGVECPLWTETITKMADIEFMMYPRLAGHAEVGWTPLSMRNWSEYKLRLKEQGPRMTNEGINFYRDPVVPW